MKKFDIVKIIPNPYFIKVHEGENITEIIDKHAEGIELYYSSVFSIGGFREVKSTVHEAHEHGFFEELESEQATYFKRSLRSIARCSEESVVINGYLETADQNGDWSLFEKLSEVIEDYEAYCEALGYNFK